MELEDFLVKAKKSTYAGASGDSKNILEDGSKEFSFSDGNYSYRDRYFGSDPFVGQEVVIKDNKAIWSMNYYGEILNKAFAENEIYPFLKKALSEVSNDLPFRGPVEYQIDEYIYKNDVEGNLKSFKGTEGIYFNDHLIYRLYYHGGLVE